VLALRGFWADAQNLYLMPVDVYAWWWLPFVFIWGLVVAGMVRTWRQQRGLAVTLGGIGIVATILAVGGPLNDWLASWVPFFGGYREPQKFVALLAFVFSYGAAQGAVALWQWLGQWGSRYQQITLIVVLLPLLGAPLMLGGFAGQLRPRDYPADWYALNSYFREHHAKKVLFLPWHMYMRFDFAGRVIANPADKFFDPVVITSGDPELKGAKSYGQTADQKYIGQALLPAAKKGGAIAGVLATKGVEYIVLAKEFDYKEYEYLQKQLGLKLVKDGPTLQLYKVESLRGGL